VNKNRGVEHTEVFNLYRQTRAKVAELLVAVERGERAQEALSFGRYLQWSGITRLCRANSQYDRHLQIDGPLLDGEISDLIARALKVPEKPTSARSDFEQRVLRNLDMIAGHVRSLTLPASAGRSTAGGVQ